MMGQGTVLVLIFESVAMKGEMPFSVTPKKSNTEEHQESRYDSPPKPHEHADLELPSDLQYRLERVFEEASIREENYVKTIQEQESRLQTQAQQYLEALRGIRKEFTAFLAVRGTKAEPRWKQAAQEKRQARRQQAIRLNPFTFSLQTRLDHDKSTRSESSPKMQPTLQCHIICYYFTPLVEDYLRDHLPSQLQLTIRSLYPNQQASHEIRIVKEEDELDNISCLLHRVPFQIATLEGEAIRFQFVIPCSQEAISHYRRREFQLELIDMNGNLPYGSASLSLSSLLNYDHQATEWQLRPLPFYCPLSGRTVGEMSIKLGNNLVLTDRSEHYRVESTVPMKVAQPVLYNDDESRLIQRISKFKTAHNSVLMGIGSQNVGNAERLFQSENEKIVLLHRQKKELESIQEYKNSHKQELMGKICSEALDRFCLADCHVGLPRYVVHMHTNGNRQHRKVYLKTELTLKNSEDKPPTAGQIALKQALHVSILTPKQVSKLLQEDLLKLPSDAHCDYELDEQEQSLWTVSGMPHPLVLRVICFPPALSLLSSSNMQGHYQLALTLTDDYNQLVESYHTKLRLKLPPLERHLHLHGYINTCSHITLTFPPNSTKEVVSNIPALACSWDASWSTLKLKVEHQSLLQRDYYLIVNAADHVFQLGSYRITVCTYPPLVPSLALTPGEIRKFTLPFTLDEATLTALLQPATAPARRQDQLRVLFACSRPEHCLVRCQGESELLCKANKLYEVEIRLQSFDLSPDPERILIHAMDLSSRRILKKWLVEVEKEKAEFRQVLKLICEMNKPTRYKLELTNPHPQERTYRLFSSNLGILKVPLTGIALIGSQRSVVELEFEVRQEISSDQQMQALQVVVTVTDGSGFDNYLFELTLRTR